MAAQSDCRYVLGCRASLITSRRCGGACALRDESWTTRSSSSISVSVNASSAVPAAPGCGANYGASEKRRIHDCVIVRDGLPSK
jgi:hypothetical protein